MKMHEVETVEKSDAFWVYRRAVPSGWVYSFDWGNAVERVFAPDPTAEHVTGAPAVNELLEQLAASAKRIDELRAHIDALELDLRGFTLGG